MKLLIGNDQLLTISGVRDAITDETLDAATVEVTIKTRDGIAVDGQSWPLLLTPEGAGVYSGILEDGLQLSKGDYLLEISIDAGDDLVAFFKMTVSANYRRTNDI